MSDVKSTVTGRASGLIRRVVAGAVAIGYVCGGVAATASDGKGLIGATLTQDRLFLYHSQGVAITNIFLYGWGSFWPDDNDGEANEHDSGASIDRRVRQAVVDGQEIMLSCATAPSNYRASHKPWNMQERVTEDMEDRFASHCADAVKRWGFKRVQVWNELKGYWKAGKAHRWGYEDYTRFYNKVYHAVKSGNPDAQVGGGYIALGERGVTEDIGDGVKIEKPALDALRYWLAHADGHDAVCVDALRRPEDFIIITHYLRKLAPETPIWWSEYYSDSSTDMRAARDAIARDQRPGDVALWWAERRFNWEAEPIGELPR